MASKAIYKCLTASLFCLIVLVYPFSRRPIVNVSRCTKNSNERFNSTFLQSERDRNLVTAFLSFPIMTGPQFNRSTFNTKQHSHFETRMQDYLESLQYTLDHPNVNLVYLLYHDISMPEYIEKNIGDHRKLKLFPVKDTYHYSTVFGFVHKYFQNQLVMITNADVYPRRGLEKINYDLMKKERLFYAPSRHGRKEKRCNMYPEICDLPYVPPGAHDTYIFIPTGPLPPEGVELLNRKWDTLGMENVILHVYKNILPYRVINPCHVIHMYHNHCSRLRHLDEHRGTFNLEFAPRQEYAYPTARLQ